jgi:RNA polymerase sigma-70 factor (ECF subfamily)
MSQDKYILNNLFSDYRSRFVRFANTYIRNEAAAEDIVMEAIAQYWANRDLLRSDTNPPAYILTIVKNKCLNHIRHQRVHRDAAEKIVGNYHWELQTRIASLKACEPDIIFTEEAQAIVDKTLASLPERTRTLFIMSRREYKSNREIASSFGMSVKGVEFHISKALKALRENLKDYIHS